MLICQVMALFGLFLTLCGSIAVSIALTLALVAVLVVASNAKHAMLGEPLVFSDLALIGAIFRHPQFYLSAVPLWERAAAAAVAAALLGVIAWLFVADATAHALGLAILVCALALLFLSLRIGSFRRLACEIGRLGT